MNLPLKKSVSFKVGTKETLSDLDNDSISLCSGSSKLSGRSLPSFSLRSLARRGSLNSSVRSQPSRPTRRGSLSSTSAGLLSSKAVPRRGSLNNSLSSLQERLVPNRNYGKLEYNEENDFEYKFDESDGDHFDLSRVLQDASKGASVCDDKWNSFHTLPTVADSLSNDDEDDDTSLEDEEPSPISSKCYITPGRAGLAHIMINTDDPTYGTLWVQSPNSSRQHLELNISLKTPKAPQRRRNRRGAIRGPPMKTLMLPFCS